MNKPQQKNADGDRENPPAENPLSNLLSALSTPKPTPPKEKPKPPAPLQANMLNVMRSHDEFIKRVNSSTKPPIK